MLLVYCRQLYAMANCVSVKIVNDPSCLRCISGAVRQCGGSLQGHQRQRYQFQQSVNPRTAATTWVQSGIRDAWTSAGVRARREIQQDEQRHDVPRDTRAWSSVAPVHSLGRVGLTGYANRDDWSLAIHAGLRTLTAWTTGGAEGDVDRSARTT